MNAAQNGHKEEVKLLIQAGADVNYRRTPGTDYIQEKTALEFARKMRNQSIVQILKQAGAQE